MIKHPNRQRRDVIDLTVASDDYPLAVGETAIVTYASATSVPLKIATVEGLYHIIQSGVSAPDSYTNGEYQINPNNTTYTNEMRRQYHDQQNTGHSVGVETTQSSFRVGGYGYSYYSDITISTRTTCKYVIAKGSGKLNANTVDGQFLTILWLDTDTVWSSLGTAVFTQAQSGTFMITRIL